MERMLYGAARMRGYGLKVQLNDAKSSLLVTQVNGNSREQKNRREAGITSVAKTDVHGIGDKGRREVSWE